MPLEQTLFHIEPDLTAAELLKERICQTKNLQYLGSAATGARGLAACRDLEPDIVLLELQMRDTDGFDLVQKLAQLPKKPKVILFTTRSDDRMIFRCQSSPIVGIVWKTESGLQDLILAIGEAVAGRTYFHPEYRKAMHLLASREDAFFKFLSNKEQELIRHLGRGETDKEIAERIGVKPSTIHTHRLNIMRKLNLDRKDKIMLWAIERGFVHIPMPSAPCVAKDSPSPRRMRNVSTK